MDTKSLENKGCPWHQSYSNAAYASDAIIRFLAGPLGFASAHIRSLFSPRSGFALCINDFPCDRPVLLNDARFVGALAGKIVHRGIPAPCSLLVERHILQEAQKAGILDFEEQSKTGEIKFFCHPRISRLDLMLKATLLPELLIENENLDSLLDCYKELCTAPEQSFFDLLIDLLPDKRLALLFLPQRLINSMVMPGAIDNVNIAGRVDFAIEIPFFTKEGWLRVAIEIDDESHAGVQKQQDDERDKALQGSGWEVLRLRLKEEQDWGLSVVKITGLINDAVSDDILSAAKELRNLPSEKKKPIQNLILLPVAEAQIFAALAHLFYQGGTSEITIGNPQRLGIHKVVEAIRETLDAILSLHGIDGIELPRLATDESKKPDILYFAGPSTQVWELIRRSKPAIVAPTFVSPSYVEPLMPAKPREIDVSSSQRRQTVRKSLLYYLQNVFRKVEFREGQIDILEHALSLRPVVGLLPTAAGKSLCYQLASFTQPGFTLVVDPLRSLMLDQQENLETMGIHRCLAIMSGMEATEIEDLRFKKEGYLSIERGQQIFVFVAPERLQMPDFRDHIKSFSANVPIPYCVVDEAHCVSEWGHDFRPSYLNVGRLIQTYCEHDGVKPSLLALTGTASRNVIIDIMRELEIDDQEAIVEPRSFDRGELDFEVIKVKASDRMAVIAGKLRGVLTEFGWRPGQPGELPSGLIFTYFVNDPNIGVSQMAKRLGARLNIPFEIYCGKQPYGIGKSKLDWEQKKLETQRRFRRNEAPNLICTSAFGMGIDKPDIRFTIHTMLPRSLEEFYQQSGRAGRDRNHSRCIVIFVDDQPGLADELLDTERTSLEEIAAKAIQVPRDSQGDAIRNTWFLTENFLGRDLEKKLLSHVISKILLPNLGTHAGDLIAFDVPFAALPDSVVRRAKDQKVKYDSKVTALEKALYRLLIVGAIVDYKKDYTGKKFPVDLRGVDIHGIYGNLKSYLQRYATEGEVRLFLPPDRKDSYQEAAYDCGCALIDFIYAKIEKRRRRAIGEMLLTAREAATLGPEQFRKQLLEYLEESEFTKPVLEIATQSQINPHDWFKVLSQVTGVDGISKLLGACRRQLEESPSHPGLLIMAGLCRIASPNPYQGFQDLRGGFIALKRYYSDPQQRLWVARKILEHARRLIPSKLDAVLAAILEGDPSYDLARFGYEQAGIDSEAQHKAIILLANEVLNTIQTNRVGL